MLLFFFLHFKSLFPCGFVVVLFSMLTSVAFSGDSEFVGFFPFSEVADVCAAVTA